MDIIKKKRIVRQNMKNTKGKLISKMHHRLKNKSQNKVQLLKSLHKIDVGSNQEQDFLKSQIADQHYSDNERSNNNDEPINDKEISNFGDESVHFDADFEGSIINLNPGTILSYDDIQKLAPDTIVMLDGQAVHSVVMQADDGNAGANESIKTSSKDIQKITEGFPNNGISDSEETVEGKFSFLNLAICSVVNKFLIR